MLKTYKYRLYPNKQQVVAIKMVKKHYPSENGFVLNVGQIMKEI